jgi:sporulation and spore germination protein/immunoglobulin-like protein involved in spore germination
MNRPASILVIALLAGSLGACGGSSGALGTVPPPSAAASVDTGPDLTPGPTTSPAPSDVPSTEPGTSPSTAPTPTSSSGDTMVVRAYFVLAGQTGSSGLVAVLREVPQTKATATAAINALLAGPTADEQHDDQISSAVADGSRLLGLTIRNGIATIDLSSEFESGGGSGSARNRLGQLVFTLTQFSTVQSVVLQIDGRTVSVFGSEGIALDGPVGRADFEDLLPAIFVDRPAFGAAIGNPARVAGSADVFEATFRVTILDGAGNSLADQRVMATCGTGCRGTFDVKVTYAISKAQWGTLRVWDGSAKDGSPENVREYRVWLTPAG